jgi:hypothetical protein
LQYSDSSSHFVSVYLNLFVNTPQHQPAAETIVSMTDV